MLCQLKNGVKRTEYMTITNITFNNSTAQLALLVTLRCSAFEIRAVQCSAVQCSAALIHGAWSDITIVEIVRTIARTAGITIVRTKECGLWTKSASFFTWGTQWCQRSLQCKSHAYEMRDHWAFQSVLIIEPIQLHSTLYYVFYNEGFK